MTVPVMAIFPIDHDTRPTAQMCDAAMMTAREALSRLAALNKSRNWRDLDPLGLGIGLHVGKVMYGNIGVDQRMDMTVTGPAANEVARIESLCRPLGIPIIASRDFQQAFDGDLSSLGDHKLDGIASNLEVFTQPDLVA